MRSASLSRFAILVSALAVLTFASTSFAASLCLDPGHGGSDSGATGNGQLEKTNTLNTMAKYKVWLDKDTADGGGGGSWSVYRTRSTDIYVSLSGRATYANNNGVNRFMCFHNNAFNGSASGIETFCAPSLGTSADLRAKVYEEAVAMWPLVRRGQKTANFYVLIYTNMPAQLHEAAFIDNYGDSLYTGNSTHQDNHAKSELWAIQRHYGLAKYTPNTGVTVIVDNTSGNFTPGTGWWTGAYGNYYGSNYHTRGTAAVSDASTFNYSLASAGTYSVYAWWADGANRSTGTPYIISRSGGTTTVNANQQVNGGKWNLLGTYSIAAGANTVKVSCWAASGYYVIADAIKVSNQ